MPRAGTPGGVDEEAMLRRRAAFFAVAVTILASCRSAPIPPTYTQDELEAICERTGGWWHPDGLIGGYCEYQSDGFR